MQSNFGLEQLTKEKQWNQKPERFNSFLYQGEKKPNIVIRINIVDKLPEIKESKNVFSTYHPDTDNENWRLLKKGFGIPDE